MVRGVQGGAACTWCGGCKGWGCMLTLTLRLILRARSEDEGGEGGEG